MQLVVQQPDCAYSEFVLHATKSTPWILTMSAAVHPLVGVAGSGCMRWRCRLFMPPAPLDNNALDVLTCKNRRTKLLKLQFPKFKIGANTIRKAPQSRVGSRIDSRSNTQQFGLDTEAGVAW